MVIRSNISFSAWHAHFFGQCNRFISHYHPVSFTIAPDMVPVCNVRSILLPPCTPPPPPSEEYNMVFVNADLITVCQVLYQVKVQIGIFTFFYEVLTITSDMKCDIMCQYRGGGEGGGVVPLWVVRL